MWLSTGTKLKYMILRWLRTTPRPTQTAMIIRLLRFEQNNMSPTMNETCDMYTKYLQWIYTIRLDSSSLLFMANRASNIYKVSRGILCTQLKCDVKHNYIDLVIHTKCLSTIELALRCTTRVIYINNPSWPL